MCWGKSIDNQQLHRELWISWGSLLRSYAAAHGLNSKQFAVIEFGEDVIVVRGSQSDPDPIVRKIIEGIGRHLRSYASPGGE